MGIRRGSISTPIIADGLVFNMDAANRASYSKTGTLVNNTVNINNSGTISGATFEDTNFGIFNFDGGDDIIVLDTELDLGTTSTVSVWLKQSTPLDAEAILGNSISSKYLLYIDANGAYVRFNAQLHTFFAAVVKTAIHVTDWINITFVRKITTVDFYVNSIKLQSITNTSTPTSNTLMNAIGAEPDFTGDYEGKIANVTGYNRALSSNEVLHNYNALKGRFGL